MADNVREYMKNKAMDEINCYAGGIICDCMEKIGLKYYNFVSHFIEVRGKGAETQQRKWKMRKSLLFITRCVGSESAQVLRERIDKNLVDLNTSVDDIKELFTFVSDCASTIPSVLGASVSSSRVAYSERWVGCFSDKLHTSITFAFEHVRSKHIFRFGQTEAANNIFETKEFNKRLSAVKHLQPEVASRFGSVHDMLKRFFVD